MSTLVSRPPSNLPADVTSFVGRRYELAEAKRLLSRSRLLTLTGVGGVGKTRLAVRIAAIQQRAFPDGVWLVDLAALEDPGLLPQTVSAALGLRDQSARSRLATLSEYLADKALLLVLDNCEHLLDACATLVETLLRAAPDLRVLATSRQPLGAEGEHTLAVPSLSVPDPDSGRPPTLDALEQYEAVSLFADRASAVLPSFTLNPSNSATVVRLCQRLDGIPLAIELAAVRLRALSIDQILDRLDNRFQLLTVGSRTALPRQQTLRALMDWSFDLCSPGQQLLWARLSVFSGGFDLAAAESVCAADGLAQDEVFPLVAGLVDKSILIRKEHGAQVRYRLLETVRQYGRQRLAGAGQERLLRRRHRDWYARLATQAEAAWLSQDQVDSLLRLQLERANLRVALDFCLSEPGEAEAGLEIGAALWGYWIFSGSLGEGRRWLDHALRLRPEPSPARAKALWVDSWLALLQGDLAAAWPKLEECQQLGERLHDPSALAHAAQYSGLAALFQGDFTGAVRLLTDALGQYRDAGDLNGEWVTLYQLATALAVRDEDGGAEIAAQTAAECLELCTSRGAVWSRSYALWVAGLQAWRLHDPCRAANLLQEAIRLKRPFNDQWGIGLCLEALAWALAAQDRPDRAARMLGAAQMVWRLNGTSLAGLGHIVGFHRQVEVGLRQTLGARAFQAAVQAGAEFTLDQALGYALEEEPLRTGAGRGPAALAAPDPPVPLTRREQEIAELVAQGLSNRQIATKLVIAQRTAEAHVAHILSKLGFSARTQIAAWVTEHRTSSSG